MAKRKSKINLPLLMAGAAVAWFLFKSQKTVGYIGSHNTDGKTYVGTYKVLKIFRVSRRRELIETGLTRDEAMRVVNRYPDSPNHMVVFTKQFTSSKYYK